MKRVLASLLAVSVTFSGCVGLLQGEQSVKIRTNNPYARCSVLGGPARDGVQAHGGVLSVDLNPQTGHTLVVTAPGNEPQTFYTTSSSSVGKTFLAITGDCLLILLECASLYGIIAGLPLTIRDMTRAPVSSVDQHDLTATFAVVDVLPQPEAPSREAVAVQEQIDAERNASASASPAVAPSLAPSPSPTPKRQDVRVCECGELFPETAKFCPGCGRRR